MQVPLRERVVFVVDDDSAVRAAVKFALELEGLAVHTCASGAELLRHPDLARSDCIVLDYKMQEMDGLAVLGRLRNSGTGTPVILIVSTATDKICEQAARAGVYRVLEKPLFDNALLTTIEEILSHR